MRARVRRWMARVRALPRRAKVALAAAVVLAVVAVLLIVVPGGGGDGGERSDDGEVEPGELTTTSTTLRTGEVEVDAPDGWQAIPLPDIEVGLAVPPGWEAVKLSPEGLEALSNASPAVPGFTENAHAAAADGGLLYAAGQDAAGRVSDLVLRAAPGTGVADGAGLESYARELAARRPGEPRVEVVEDASRPTVRLRFQLAGEDGSGVVAEGTEVLVLGPRDVVWSLTVTSEDATIHDDLVDAVAGTLAFPGE
ncbi:MAG TPA: hypothetical protein VKZ72_08860 [Acidimicrobiales bacterium]|nr:hypothetical protein [Acidimicrobiales bacterium]